MFQAAHGILENGHDKKIHISVDGIRYTVLKRFEFDHHRMTMSVVVQDEDGKIFVFVEGCGESIKSICTITRIPLSFDKESELSAKKGVYQISVAMKIISPDFGSESSISIVTRDELEKDLTFVGVINFKNALREETADVIQQLRDGDIMSVIVTGDSVLTGLCIARESGIIKTNESVLIVKGVRDDGERVWVDEDDQVVPPPTLMHLMEGNTVLAMSGNMWRIVPCLWSLYTQR